CARDAAGDFDSW
nr:immunoglobulin heavy chain junction region [Macaca mulatta]